MKASCYPEYFCCPARGPRARPAGEVDRRALRQFPFRSATAGTTTWCVEGAFDADGHILALRIEGYGNLGAYLSNATALPPTSNTVNNSIGVYRTPAAGSDLPRDVHEHDAGRAVSRSRTARRAITISSGCSISPRRRWASTGSTSAGATTSAQRRCHSIRPPARPYDSGDFPAVLEKALALADWDDFAARKAESERRGKLRGRGIGQYLEVTAPPANEMGGIRFEPDGTVTIITGTLDYGQGHASPFAQVLTERLGIPFEKINAAAGRQRRTDRGRRHGRLEVDHGERRRDHRGQRESHREGEGDRGPRAGSRRRGYRVRCGAIHDRRHGPRESASWSSRKSCAPA